jgi:hypothetical protein
MEPWTIAAGRMTLKLERKAIEGAFAKEIASLGGWTGYHGKPGPKVMRRGLDDFRRIKYGTTLRFPDV